MSLSYLHKAYEELHWGYSLSILEGYQVVPEVCQLPTRYWDWSTTAAKTRKYFRDSFQGSHDVTQGDPLYPWIFNIVVDAIDRHWVGLVVENETGPDGLWYMVSKKAAFFKRQSRPCCFYQPSVATVGL